MNTNQLKILKKAEMFHGINDSDFESLINCLSPQIKHFSKNEVIVLAGYTVSNIGIIISGNAYAYSENIDGTQTLISSLGVSRTFGDTLVGTKTHKSPVTVYAATDVTAAFIEYNQIYAKNTADCPAYMIFLQNIFKIIGDKYFLLFDRINILREKTLRQRITLYLYKLSDDGRVSEVMLPFTKTMLADYLLINRSALSRELGKMEKDGLIIVKGRRVTLLF